MNIMINKRDLIRFNIFSPILTTKFLLFSWVFLPKFLSLYVFSVLFYTIFNILAKFLIEYTYIIETHAYFFYIILSISCIFVSSFHIQCNLRCPSYTYLRYSLAVTCFTLSHVFRRWAAWTIRRSKHRPNRHPRKPNQQHSYLSLASGELSSTSPC